MRVESHLADLALHLECKRVKVGRAVRANIRRAHKLRIRPARLDERGQARLWFIDVEAVIHSARPGALVREPQSDAVKLALDGEIELVDAPISRVGGESGNALGRDRASAGGERIRKCE